MRVIEKIGDIERITEISSDELYGLLKLYRMTPIVGPFKERLKAFIDKFLEVEQKK